ncbi:hypothetical protein [Paenibacillus sp. OK003]|uniref:hypothetical protein n=1 Tax=Paenibacillus sp. OK003 TaxID=1884380 RepID=UPI0008D4E03D|nr:hypothetical protein [Paenibacillus sp. OK003]SEL32575.1 ABC-2 type transport system permease protein [Paenibacillus sp. OK003]
MNNHTLELIRVRLRNQFEWSKLWDKNVATKTHAMITNIGYLTAFILVLGYVATLPYQMSMDHQLEMVNPYISSLLFWVLGIWTVLSGVKNVLVGSDHDQIFVLPIEEWQAKLLNIFSQVLVQVVICGSVLLVAQVPLYLLQPFPLINLLVVAIYVVATPLLAIGSSIVVSLLVKWFVALLKVKNTLIEAVLTLLLFIAPLLYAYITHSPFNSKSGVINTSFLNVSLLEGLNGSQWLKIVIFFIAVLGLFSLICLVIVKKYNQIVLLMGARTTAAKRYSLEISPVLTALFKKEINRYFSSFTYVINTILAPCALLIVALGLGFGLLPNFTPFTIAALDLTITSSFIYYVIFIVCVTLTTTTSCSFSFEGKNVWIIQSLPISVAELSIAKGLLNILLFIPGLIASTISCWSALGLRGMDFLVHTMLLFISVVCITTVGLFINLKFPNFNWSNEMVVVKQGMPTIITAVISMGLIALSAALLLFLGTTSILALFVVEVLVVIFLTMKIRKISYL